MVATPIGNLGDISPRATQTLAEAELILAEDTRKTRLLLSAIGIKGKKLLSLHDHNEESRLPELMAALDRGANLALVSDAGTPLLSDPGFRLVRAARRAGHQVTPLPGPSTPLAALSAAGIPPTPFVFMGFAPRKPGEIKQFFAPYSGLQASLVFFERKDRVKATLALAAPLLGPRECCIARELTKLHEEFIIFRLEDSASLADELLGEICVLIGPPEQCARTPEQTLLEMAEEYTAGGELKGRGLARALKENSTGWSVDEIYRLLSEAKTSGRDCEKARREKP